ncbi:MAG: hypothetical protein ACOVOY_10010 [Sediminibacterium sp.]
MKFRKRVGSLFQGGKEAIIFEKNGKQVSVPLHESKEMGKGLEMKLRKGMGI